MAALTILIIRHAEKPDGSWPGPGLTADGAGDKKSLVVRGWQRAGSWSALFGAAFAGDDFPRPAVIYAANPTAQSGDDPSQRPFETISPLAARLNLAPVVKFGLGQEPALVAEVVGLTGVVLAHGSTRRSPPRSFQRSRMARPYRECRANGTERASTSCFGSTGAPQERPGRFVSSFRVCFPATPIRR
jgi:hypothetical protein